MGKLHRTFERLRYLQAAIIKHLIGSEAQMNIGLLWFDNSFDKDVDTKVREACDYYQKKYGRTPNVCFVHPSLANPGSIEVIDGVIVKANRSVLPNHFWIGIEDQA